MNREAERKRLVELIENFFEEEIGASFVKGFLDKFADHLLDNGVIVPPFKIGETLYDVSEYVYGIPCPEIYEMENDRMTIEKLENGDFIFIYEDAEIRHEDMGVTIYSSREQAEQALKGGER